MKKFKIFSYLAAIVLVLFTAGQHSLLETAGALFALISGFGISPSFVFGACSELTAFRIAVESLEDGVLDSPAFQRANFFRNVFPAGEFVQNQGTTRSNFTIKPSAPTD